MFTQSDKAAAPAQEADLLTAAPADSLPMAALPAADSVPTTDSVPTATSQTASRNNDKESAEEKGKEFVKLVISKFSKSYFKLKEWRSDKYEDGIYAEANTYPDLEFEFTLRDMKSAFAIECKWRKGYYKNGLEWAKEYQIKNYQNFAKEKNIPVFVVLGVGGTPNNPDEVFVLPLAQAGSIFISQSELKQYQKTDFKEKNFFFDNKAAVLR